MSNQPSPCWKPKDINVWRNSIDPDLWDEADLPLLRAIKREHEDAQEPESGVLPDEQPNMTEDDEGTRADTGAADDE
jgi:hypothetical protein